MKGGIAFELSANHMNYQVSFESKTARSNIACGL